MIPRSRTALGFSTVVVLLLGSASSPHAKVSQAGGISLRFDPSVRATGMGAAGNAVFWGQDPDYWANPALLGYHSGIRFHHSKTQLVPDLADDVFFETDRYTVGAWGLGLAFGGKPIGKIRLDLGSQGYTDEGGTIIGEFVAYQEVESIGIGFSFGRLVSSLADVRGVVVPPLLRLGDVAVGYTHKDFVDVLAPDGITQDGASGRAESSSQDFGVFLRVSPIDTMDPATAGLFPEALRALGMQLDFAYGYSIQGFDENEIVFETSQADPLARVPRHGIAGRLAIGGERVFENSGLAWLGRAITPLLAIGFAKDSFEETALIDGERITEAEIDGHGIEFTLLNVFSWRTGHYDDPEGDIDGDTSGWSVGLEFDGIGGFRYDKATRPQATDLDEVELEAYTLYFDALALWRALH